MHRQVEVYFGRDTQKMMIKLIMAAAAALAATGLFCAGLTGCAVDQTIVQVRPPADMQPLEDMIE